MKLLNTSPVLRSQAKTGKAKFWQVRLLEDAGRYYIQKTWWQDNTVKQDSVPEQVQGKNEGRSNATSDREQAELAFARAIQKRRDKGFSEDGSAKHVYPKPMLAHNFSARKHTLEWPVFVQPKLDGFRMLMDGEDAWTRGGKDHVRECVQHLMWDTEGYIVDGELLLPGNRLLQITAAAAKKYRPGVSETLEYHVYDVVESELAFPDRHALLRNLLVNAPKNVKLVLTAEARDEAEVLANHTRFVQGGYEGSIVRTPNGLYEVGFRSNSLLKLKDFQDAEFTVVGVEHGKGSFSDKAILVFLTEDGATFNAVPEGTAEYRAELYRVRNELIGQTWTVRYQSLSKEGKPVFPVAVAPREVEETI